MLLAGSLVLAVSVLAAVAARPLAEWLPPLAAAWLLVSGALVLAMASGAMLGLLALAAAVRTPSVAAAGHESLRLITSQDPAPLALGVVAAVLLCVAALAAVRVAWRRAGALVSAHRRGRRLPSAGQVVVIDDVAADAYAVPGWPGRIVVTSGMMQALSADERRVLIAHERAHVAGCHYLFAAGARLAAAVSPLLRPLVPAIGYSLERWSDEQAASAVGDRELAARAIARAALAVAAAPPGRGAPGSALGAVASPAGLRGAGEVPRRVAALLRPAPPPRWLLLSAGVLLVAACGLSVMAAALSLHGLIEAAQAARSR